MGKINTDSIIDAVCKALDLDKDKLIIDKPIRNFDYLQKYTPAKQIAASLIRANVLIEKNSKTYGKTLKQITYNDIASIFKRKSHAQIIHWEIDCKINIRQDKEFSNKYNMVVDLLDNNVNIA